MKEKLTIVKVGGKIVEEADTLSYLLIFLQFLAISCWYMVVDALQQKLLPNWV